LSRRVLASLTYALAAAVALLDPNYLGLGFSAACAVVLTLGYRYRGDFMLVASGWLLYLPLSAVLYPAFGDFWSYLVAGSILAILTERMSFENQMSRVLEAPKGIDYESRRLAGELSRSHLRRLLMVASFTVGVAIVSSVVSFVVSAVTFLIFGSVMLLVLVAVYAWRGAQGPPPGGVEEGETPLHHKDARSVK
jgi:hypothetical protein